MDETAPVDPPGPWWWEGPASDWIYWIAGYGRGSDPGGPNECFAAGTTETAAGFVEDMTAPRLWRQDRGQDSQDEPHGTGRLGSVSLIADP